MKKIYFDVNKLFVPSIFRNVINSFENKEFLIDTKSDIQSSDIVCSKLITQIEGVNTNLGMSINYGERIIKHKSNYYLTNSIPKVNDLVLSVVGNRFSTVSCCGGIINPLTYETNNKITPESIVHNIGNFNIIGRLNYNHTNENPAELKILGKLISLEDNQYLNLLNYCSYFDNNVRDKFNNPLYIIVGDDTECGKTQCCVNLATSCLDLKIKYIYTKITGGPRIRDMLKVCKPNIRFSNISDKIRLSLLKNVYDFTDVGYPSSHTVDNYINFVNKSIGYLKYCSKINKANISIVEIAGNLHQYPNEQILSELLKFDKIVIIVAIKHGIESILNIFSYLNSQNIDSCDIFFSGVISSLADSKFYKDFVEKKLYCNWISSTLDIKELEQNENEWKSRVLKRYYKF